MSTREDSSPTPSPWCGPGQSDPGRLAEAVAVVVRAHPAVVDLDGGPFGVVASYLPGRRVVGVRIAEPLDPVEVSVVVRLGIPLPRLATELRRVISAVTGPRAIDLIVNDVIVDDPLPDSPYQYGRYT